MKKIKKLIITILLFIILAHMTAGAEVKDRIEINSLFEDAKVDLTIIEDDETISRNDCIALIMTAIGMPHNYYAESYGFTRILEMEDVSKDVCKFMTTDYVDAVVRNTDIIAGEGKKLG